jgi:hypothetical protein
MYTVQNPAGRLLAIRYVGALTLEEGERSIAEIRALFASAKTKLVLCGDLREVGVLPAALSDRFVAMFKQDNAKLERNGMLIGNAIVALQIERMIREANSPVRRTLRDVEQLEQFLTPLLTPAEREALASFVR